MSRLRGLYAITPGDIPEPSRLAALVRAAIVGGAALIQFRDKTPDAAGRRARAAAVLAACRTAGVPLIVNDDLDLAAELGADGVHLGRRDAPLEQARARLGAKALVGVSCYDDLALARAARHQGADYVAFGSFFASPTKPLAVRAPSALLHAAAVELGLPVVAIGGITPENGRALVAAGADMLAVVSGVFAAADVTAAARAYARLFPEEL
jgi:thiamine-phosphate pyrophosphorylase